MRLLLARHGETAWNVEGRYQGQSFDIPLSQVGVAQAEALGRRLRGLAIRRAVASPMLRSRQTAEIALKGHGLELGFDAGLREIAHGDWEGRLASDVAEAYPDLRRAWRETPQAVRPPGGESFQEVQMRAWEAIHRASQGLGSEDVLLVVAHDGANRSILCKALGLSLARVWSFRQAPTCLNLLEGEDPDHLTIVRLNDASHLVPLFGEVIHRRL